MFDPKRGLIKILKKEDIALGIPLLCEQCDAYPPIDACPEGAKKAGRSIEDFEMALYLPIVINDDLDKAVKIAKDFAKLFSHTRKVAVL